MREQSYLNPTREGSAARLADQIAGSLSTAKLRATKAALTVLPISGQADFVAAEADYSGYPAGGVAVVWSAAGQDGDGNPIYASQRIRFQPTGTGTLNTLYAFWLAFQFAAGPPIVLQSLFYALLGTPKQLLGTLSFVDATVYVTIRPDGISGWIDVED